MCCMRLAGNAGPKKSPKIRHQGTIAQLCRAISSQLRHVSTIEKNLLNSNISSTHLHNIVNFWPNNSWDLLATLGHPSKFQLISRLGFVTAPTLLNGGQQNFAGCFAISWADTLYIHFRWLLPWQNFARCKVDSRVVVIWMMAMTAAVVEPVGPNTNWSLKTSNGGGVSNAG